MPKTEKPKAKSAANKQKNPKVEPLSKRPLLAEIEQLVEDILKPHHFIDSAGNKKQLTGLQHKFCLEYLANGGNGTQAVIECGYDVFYKNAKGDSTETVNYGLARVMASENLAKPNICAFINSKLVEYGYDDKNVELQHLFLINQNADLQAKRGALDMFYKLKDRYPRQKVDVNHTFDTVEIENFGSKEKHE